MGTKSEKAMSGRWQLCASAAISLLIFVVADCVLAKPVIDPMALLAVITSIISYYLAKAPDNKPENKS